MKEAEFDKFADEYLQMHARNIRASGESPEFFARYKVEDAVDQIKGNRSSSSVSVLDLGAGIGTSVPFFTELLDDCSLVCLDVSGRSLEIGRSRLGDKAEFVKFDGSTIPYDEDTFDLVFVACVFHHIDASEHVDLLREVRRVLAPGGTLMLFEHNPWNPLTVHAVNTCPFDENAVLISARVMVERCTRAGFDRISRRYRIFFPGFMRAIRPLERYLSWLPLGAQYYIAAEKAAA